MHCLNVYHLKRLLHTHTHSHTHTEGCDALIVAYEDERYVVVAGTFKKLVEQLACEEKPGET